jgi:hypothetical protein
MFHINPQFFPMLREANLRRLPTHRNKRNEMSHSEPDGSDWSTAQWQQAMVGELGEYANERKKYERGDHDLHEFLPLAASELADTATYLDILAYQHKVEFSIAKLSVRGLPALPDPKETDAAVWVRLFCSHLGSYSNYTEAYERGTMDTRQYRQGVEHHLNGMMAVLYSLFDVYELNFADEIINKFNHVSERIGSPIFITKTGVQDLRDD